MGVARGSGGDGVGAAPLLPSPKRRTSAAASITSHAKAINWTDGQNWPVEMARHAPTQPVAMLPIMVSKKTCAGVGARL